VIESLSVNAKNRFAMLEYSKMILQKVSFSKELFGKELKKAIRFLKKEEVLLLQAWVMLSYNDRYGDIIREVFRNLS
jgi:3-phosphoglycerate kinase